VNIYDIKDNLVINEGGDEMNRNLRKIIAVTFIIGAFSAVIPANFNLMTTNVYASNELTSLKLKTLGGSTIKTYSDDDYKSKNEVDDDNFESDHTYYAKTSSSRIKISTSATSTSYVRVFKGTSSSTKGVKTSNSIQLSSGTNIITVRVYSEDPGTIKYSDTTNRLSEYTIKVKYTGSSSNSDDVYLKSISLSTGDLSFSKSTSTYNINVDESVDEMRITAKPDCDSDEYDSYEVRIDGTTVDEDDKFRETISLNKGKNEINITIEDDDYNKRTYTLNITRSTTTIPNTTIIKANQWIQTNGVWKYNDSTGNPIKNSWFNDRNYGKYYYLQADGSMTTGWLNYYGNWYYLGPDGARKTGWQLTSGNWYYLDSQGIMKIGWIKENGKYYYLYINGSMAYNTTIAGYKLGPSGAWIR